MLFGAFDIIILLSTLIFNWYYWKKQLHFNKWYLVAGVFVLFFFLFPYCSEQIEVNRVYALEHTGEIDGFTTMYILFRWPAYWFMGILELLFLFLVHQKRKALKLKGDQTTLDRILKEDAELLRRLGR